MVARFRLILLAGLCGVCLPNTTAQAQSQDELFAQVFAQRNQLQAPITLELEALLQDVAIGTINATVAGGAIVEIERESMLALFDTFIAEDRLALLKQSDEAVTPAELSASGIGIHYDATALAIDLSIPPEFRIEWQVPIAPLQPPAAGRSRYSGARVSGALNLQPNVVYQSGNDATNVSVFADGFVNFAGWALQGEATWSEQNQTSRRGPFRLHRDLIDQRIRLTIGELRSPSFGQQPSLPIRGISIGKIFSIDPYNPPFPGLIAPILLELPTELEVSVDGRIVERVRLPAGPALLSDFPLSNGLNDVRIDLFQEGVLLNQLSYQGWFDRIRLGSGQQEYHVSVGQPWLQGSSRPVTQQDRPWISTAIRRGMNPRWTSGLGLLLDSESGDAVIDWSNDIGFQYWTLSSDLALSRDNQPGTAGSLSVQQESLPDQPWNLRMAVGWRDHRFRPFGLDRAPGRELRGEFNVSRALNPALRWSTSLRVSDRTDDREGRLSSILAWKPTPAWSFQIRATAMRNRQDTDVGVSLVLDWRPERSNHAFSAELDDAGDWLAGWRYNAQTAGSGRNANLIAQTLDGQQIYSGSIGYRNHRIRIGADHRRTLGDQSRTQLSAQTALVFADGHFGIADRVGEGFVLFADRPGTGHVEINPDGDDARSRSGGFGAAVVGDLTPYLQRGFTIGLPDVPITSDPGDLQPVAVSGFLQGVVVPVGPMPGITLIWSLCDQDGNPLPLVYGELISDSGGDPKPFFSNRDGRVELGSVQPGNYRIEIPAVGSKTEISVADTPAVQNLGALTP